MPTQTLFDLLQAEQIATEYKPAVLVKMIVPPTDAIEPAKDLVDDIRKYGVIEPLLLQPIGNRFGIISGRRRYLAAILGARDTVPALLTRTSKAQRDVLTMKLNKLRADNFVADVRAYERLMAQKLSEKEIGDLTGLSQQEIDRRKRLITADQRILTAVLEGRATISMAEAAAKLPPRQQKRLLDQVGDQRITGRDISAVKSVASNSAVKALPQELFNVSSPADAPAGIERYAQRLFEALTELNQTGCLSVNRPKTNQNATNARIAAEALLSRIKSEMEVTNAKQLGQ